MRARGRPRRSEELIQRHQVDLQHWPSGMLYHPQDAEDASQEILVKGADPALASRAGAASALLYRIVVNHVLNMKRGRPRKSRAQLSLLWRRSDKIPTRTSPTLKANRGYNLLVTEAMLACTSGMLLCLDREQRLSYILAAISK